MASDGKSSEFLFEIKISKELSLLLQKQLSVPNYLYNLIWYLFVQMILGLLQFDIVAHEYLTNNKHHLGKMND